MSLIPSASFASPGVPLFVKMFRSTEAEISTLYASTIYVGHTFVSSIDVNGGDFKISNTSSIFDIYVSPSSVTQTLIVDSNTVGQIIIDVEDRGLKFIDSDETRYIMAASSFTVHNPLAEAQNGPTARYGIQGINFSTSLTSVDMFLNPLTETFETSLLIEGNQAGIITMGKNIVLQDATETSYIFGSSLRMHDNKAQANPTGIYDPSSITLSTFQSLVKIEQNNITLANTSTFVNQFLGTGSFETSLVTEGNQTAILTLASTTVLEDNTQTRYSFGGSNFIIHNLTLADQPTAFVSPSTIFISSISSIISLDDRNIDFLAGSNLFNIYASPDENYTALTYNSGGEEMGQIVFQSTIGGIQVRDTFGNPSYFASNAFTTANINADNITTRTLTARTIRVISTIYSESTISTIVLLADSAIVSSVIGGGPLGDLQLNSRRYITETGTGIRLNASNGFDVGTPGFIDMNAGGGNYGRISMTANAGFAGNFGRVSITANGGQNDLVGLGGLVEITATTPIGTSPSATSAIKFSASGINSYAGAIPSIGSLAGYNFIYGTAGVNITAGIPSIFPNIPLTTYIYGTAGVVIGSDLYASRIYGYWGGAGFTPSNLLLSGRTTVNGTSYVVLSNVSSINGQRWPPPDIATVSSFTTASISSLTVSSINGEQYPPNIETLSTFQNIYVASTIQVASSISFVGGNGFIEGVSSISTNALLANQAQITSLSTFEATIDKMTVLEEVRVSSGGVVYVETGTLVEFLGGTGEILGVSSINNISYPPPAGDAVSTFQTASISSLAASTIAMDALFGGNATISSISTQRGLVGILDVQENLNVSSGGFVFLGSNVPLQFSAVAGLLAGQITGLSTINNIPYPPPVTVVSTFQTASISSLAASTISTSFIAMDNAFVSKEINISSGGLLGLYDGSEIIFYGATNTGVIVGVSSINNAPYPPPAGDTISTFSTFAISSLSTNFINADTIRVTTELYIEPDGALYINPGAPLYFVRVGADNVGQIQNVSSINDLPYPPPAAEILSTFQTASISSLSVSSINGASYPPPANEFVSSFSTLNVSSILSTASLIVSSINNAPYPPPGVETISTFSTLFTSSINGMVVNSTMFLSSLYVSGGVAGGSGFNGFEAGIHMETDTFNGGSARIFFNGPNSSNANQGVLSLNKANFSSYNDPNLSSILGLAVEGYSTSLGSTESIVARSIYFTGGKGPDDNTAATPITGDGSGNIIIPFSSLVGISTVNGVAFNPQVVTAERVSTQSLYFSSFNDYGFSTLSEWNVAPSGYSINGSNNKFYLGQSNIVNVVADVNDRFMLYCGNVNFGFPSTLISSVLTPGSYSPPDFVLEVNRSISTANVNYIAGGGNSNFFRDIQFAKNGADNDVLYGVTTQNIPAVSNFAIGTGLGFFSTTTGYGAPIVPLTILSSCASLVGSYNGSSIGYPDTVPLPYPQFYPAQFTGVAATAVEITLTEGGYSPSELVDELRIQFAAQPGVFSTIYVSSINKTFDEYGNTISQQLKFGINHGLPPFLPPYWSLGFSFLNSGGANAYWDLNTVPDAVLNGAATLLGFTPATQVTWSNFNASFAVGASTFVGAPVPFGSNMQFNTADILGLKVSTINLVPWQTIATQNGIASNFTITEENNTFLIGYSNIHNVINGYNNRFFITGRLSGDKYQEIVEIPAGLYDHLQFISTINPLISSTQGAFPLVWEPGLAGGSIAIEISSISSYYTTYAISTVLFADTLGLAFSTWSDQTFDSGTLAIVSTTANLFGMTASTILAGIDPVTFPSYSRTGGRSTIQLTPGTYSLQGLSDSINQSATDLGFPYDNLSTKTAFVANPDGSVSQGNLILFGNNSSNQAFAGFSSNLDYPFAYPPVIVPGLAATASTLGFNNGYVVNQQVSSVGSTITGIPAYFGSNMQFNIANVNELHTSSINGRLAQGIAYQDSAATFSSIIISSIAIGVTLSDTAFIFQAQTEQLIVSSLAGLGGSTIIQGNLIPSIPYALGTATQPWGTAFVNSFSTNLMDVSSFTAYSGVTSNLGVYNLVVSSLNGSPLDSVSSLSVSSLNCSKIGSPIINVFQLNSVSSINGLKFPFATVSTFQTASISSATISSLTSSRVVTNIASTQQLFASSINGVKPGFSTFTLATISSLTVSSINGQRYLPAMVIQAAGTTALTAANANTTYLLTSGATQNFTTTGLGAGNAGLYWYVKNTTAAGGGGGDIAIQANGVAIAGSTSTAHQNTNTQNSSLQVIYWNGTTLTMY